MFIPILGNQSVVTKTLKIHVQVSTIFEVISYALNILYRCACTIEIQIMLVCCTAILGRNVHLLQFDSFAAFWRDLFSECHILLPYSLPDICGASKAKHHVGITLSSVHLSVCRLSVLLPGFAFAGTTCTPWNTGDDILKV